MPDPSQKPDTRVRIWPVGGARVEHHLAAPLARAGVRVWISTARTLSDTLSLRPASPSQSRSPVTKSKLLVEQRGK